MIYFDAIHDLVFSLVPPVQIELNPATVLVTIGLAGLLWTERKIFK